MSEQREVVALSLWFEHAWLPTGLTAGVRLSVAEGRLSNIEVGVAARPGDEVHALAAPGLPNLHSHGFQRGIAGMAEVRGPNSDSFWTWRDVMYRFVDRCGPDELEAITALAYAEMLEGGFTRVGEFHYIHHDLDGRAYAEPAELAARVAAAAETTGIALTLLPVMYAHAGFGALPPRPEQRRFVSALDGFQRLHEGAVRAVKTLPDAVVGVAPHSLRAVTPEQLSAVAELSDGPLHIHIAEQIQEVDDCIAWSGARPIEWLLANAQVDGRWCLVHATHVETRELHGVARSGAIAGLCPITEANLGDGLFPMAEFLEAGGRFGVGSDSNVAIGAAEELRMLEYGQRLTHRSRNVLARGEGRSTAADLHQAAVEGGSQALGASAGLAVGHPADIVSLDMEHPVMLGRKPSAALDCWVFGGDRSVVATVWRGGRKMVSEGRHTRKAQIVDRYRRALKTVLA